MKRPKKRPNLPARRSNNDKRRLIPNPSQSYISKLRQNITYEGSSKHKLNPNLYGLQPFTGTRGDATLCDRDAKFDRGNYGKIHGLIIRGLNAGSVGENDVIWAVADNGWIFEGRLTNVVRTLYHGYPVRSTEPIAEMVYRRFNRWAQDHGNDSALLATRNCKALYGFR